jgi:hypothetical protein
MSKACNTYREKRNAYRALVGKREDKRILGSPGRKWMMILRWTLEKQHSKVWTEFLRLRIGTSGGLL